MRIKRPDHRTHRTILLLILVLGFIFLILPAVAQEGELNLNPIIVDKDGQPIQRPGALPPGYVPDLTAEEETPPSQPEQPVVVTAPEIPLAPILPPQQEEVALPEVETPPELREAPPQPEVAEVPELELAGPDLREAPLVPEAPEVAELPELDLNSPVLRQLEEAPELALEAPDLRLLTPAGLPPLAVDDAPDLREAPETGPLPQLAGVDPILRGGEEETILPSNLPPLASTDPTFRGGEDSQLPLMAEAPTLRSGELPPLASADPHMAGVFVGEAGILPSLPSSQIAGIVGGENPLPRLPATLLAGVTGPQRQLMIPEAVIVVPPEERVDRLNVLVPQGIQVGVPVAVVVEALDAEGNVVADYEAPIVFQSNVSVEPQVARLTNGRYEGMLTFKEVGSSVQLAVAVGNEGAQLAFAVTPPPPSFDVLYKEGLALYERGQEAEALAKLNEAAQVGDSYDLHMLRGKIYLSQGEMQASMGAFKQATSALFSRTAG